MRTYKQHQEYSQPVDGFFRHVFNAGVNAALSRWERA
jgi:hypothetical protein